MYNLLASTRTLRDSKKKNRKVDISKKQTSEVNLKTEIIGKNRIIKRISKLTIKVIKNLKSSLIDKRRNLKQNQVGKTKNDKSMKLEMIFKTDNSYHDIMQKNSIINKVLKSQY